MPEINNNHVRMMRELADAIGKTATERFNLYLAVAEKCVKQSIPIAETVDELNRRYALTVSSKTMKNELMAAVRLAEHFGGFKQYDKKVEEHNEKQHSAGKKMSYSHQRFLTTFRLVKGSTQAGRPSGRPNLAKAVKDGVITAQQAKALAKYFV